MFNYRHPKPVPKSAKRVGDRRIPTYISLISRKGSSKSPERNRYLVGYYMIFQKKNFTYYRFKLFVVQVTQLFNQDILISLTTNNKPFSEHRS